MNIAHIDCDAFYASVEKRDNPALIDQPVIIGGGRRGVVSTACYIARTYGVRSAMPMFKALEACPQAIVVRPDMAKYARVGSEVRQLMLELTPLVEPVSIDEAFLDLSGTQRLHHASPAVTLARFAARVQSKIGISVSIGLSYAKFLAKMASDLNKPRGFSIIGKAEALAMLAPRSVALLPGVGKAALSRLESIGIRTIGQMALADPARLAILGKDGARLHRLANGIDPRKVSPERETKSVSAETTLDDDLSRFDALEPILWRMSEKTSARMKRQNLAGRTVTLKLKTHDFRLITRARQVSEPTQLAARIFAASRELLLEACTGTRFRLIGVGVSDLSDPSTADHGDLADHGIGKLKAVEDAVDALRAKFGSSAVTKGIGLGRAVHPPPMSAILRKPRPDEA